MMNERYGFGEQPSHSLLTEKYGLKVARELSGDELDIKKTAERVTSEGFVIGGQNSSELIRSLSSLDGVPIARIERAMLPKHEYESGILKPTDSLPEILAEDNNTITSLGLTHQRLAGFLKYFEAASHSPLLRGDNLTRTFTFNGRTYDYQLDTFRGIHFSPFSDQTVTQQIHTLTCLDDGSVLSYTSLDIALIEQYGFYGRISPERGFGPRQIAEAAGYIEKTSDDPVAELAKNPTADVTITTPEQLFRLVETMKHRKDLQEIPGLKIVPGSFAELIEMMYQLIDNIGPEFQRRTKRNAVKYLDTAKIQQLKPELNRYTMERLDRIIDHFPDQADLMLSTFKEIDPNNLSKSDYKLIFHRILEAESRNKALSQFDIVLTDKMREAVSFETLFDTVADLAAESRPEKIEGISNIAQDLDPTFKDKLIALYKDYGFPVDESMRLADHLKKIATISKFIQMHTNAMNHVRQLGGIKDASKADVSFLLNAVYVFKQRPHYIPNPKESATLVRLNVSPALICHAIAKAGNVSRDAIVAKIYSDAIVGLKQQEEEIAAQSNETITQNDRQLVDRIMRYEGQPFTRRIDTEKFIALLLAEPKLDIDKIIKTYVSLRVPGFEDILTSDLVDVKISEHPTMEPLLFFLKGTAIDQLPLAPNQYHRTANPDRVAKIGDQEYIVNHDTIKFSGRSIQLNNGRLVTEPRKSITDLFP